ncbi:MAG: hypothetical protein LBD37_04060 [Treponema sp.]|jgi:hypothetical protein|nr:hypothetical protein [Treponema sp.]
MQKTALMMVLAFLFAGCAGQKALRTQLAYGGQAALLLDYQNNELVIVDMAAKRARNTIAAPFPLSPGSRIRWSAGNGGVYLLHEARVYELSIQSGAMRELYQPRALYDSICAAGGAIYLERPAPVPGLGSELVKYTIDSGEEETFFIDISIYNFLADETGNWLLIYGYDASRSGMFVYNRETGTCEAVDPEARVTALYSLYGGIVLYEVYNGIYNRDGALSTIKGTELRVYDWSSGKITTLPHPQDPDADDYFLLSEDSFIMTRTHLNTIAQITIAEIFGVKTDFYVANFADTARVPFYSTRSKVDLVGVAAGY